MRFEDILGQEAPISLLKKAIAAGRLPHALVFQGPESVGKGTTARVLALALLCEEGATAGPCGRCASCLRAAHGNHPDLFVVERLPKKASLAAGTAESGGPDEETKGRGDLRPFIVVSQIRELTEHAAYAPREGPCRVFLVDPADRMNAEAQNALLKTLEEPPGRSNLILVASRPHLLLPTVRSRCFPIRFAPMSVIELAAKLEGRGFPREESLARAALSGGRPGRALGLDPQALRERREEVLALLEELALGPRALADLSSMVALVAGDDEDTLAEGLDLVEALLRDAAVSAAGMPERTLVHGDLSARLGELGRRLGASRASALVRGVDRLRGEMRFNLNRTLVVETILAAAAGGPVP